MSSPLRERSAYYTRLQWALGAALLVFAVVFYAFTFRPAHREVRALRERIDRTTAELEAARARAGDLPRLSAENDALAVRLSRAKRLPQQAEWSEFVRDITRLGNQFSLRKFSYKYGEAKRHDRYLQLPITLEFEGDLMNVYAFLRQAEELPRLTRLRAISLRNAPEKEHAGSVVVEMSLNTYFSTQP